MAGDTNRRTAAARSALVLGGTTIAALAGWVVFVEVPNGNVARLLGAVFVVGAAVLGAKITSHVAATRFPDYDVAEVALEGPITRNGGRRMPTGSVERSTDDIVEQIERADDDENARALLLELNTPGGEVVPSEDIRLAAERFDGPTVAYATDTCASGGYWIASGCDELWAREGSVIGSIGVLGSRPNASALLEDLGISYERFTAGEYKDAGVPLKRIEDEERAYLQGIVDEYYERFVERVSEGRELDPEAVRATEARVYLGEEALERDLVDALGTRADVADRIADRLEVDSVTVEEFTPQQSIAGRLRGGATAIAFAFGVGVASVLGDDADEIDLRV